MNRISENDMNQANDEPIIKNEIEESFDEENTYSATWPDRISHNNIKQELDHTRGGNKWTRVIAYDKFDIKGEFEYTGDKSCSTTFKTIYNKHLENKHIKPELGCVVGANVYAASMFKPFKCKHCEKSFTRQIHLKRHGRIHTGEKLKKTFKSEHCEKCFTRPGNLKRHEKIHTGEKPFKCEQCWKCYTRRGKLKKHVFYCRDKPTQRGSIKRHVKIHTIVNIMGNFSHDQKIGNNM